MRVWQWPLSPSRVVLPAAAPIAYETVGRRRCGRCTAPSPCAQGLPARGHLREARTAAEAPADLAKPEQVALYPTASNMKMCSVRRTDYLKEN